MIWKIGTPTFFSDFVTFGTLVLHPKSSSLFHFFISHLLSETYFQSKGEILAQNRFQGIYQCFLTSSEFGDIKISSLKKELLRAIMEKKTGSFNGV
jgi:hypothetical protein